MNSFQKQFWLSVAALTLAAGLVIDELAEIWVSTAPWQVRCAFLALGLLLAVASVGFTVRRARHESSSAQRYLDLLCRLDLTQQTPPTGNRFSADSGWNGVLQRIRDSWASQAERLREAEQSRAALEIRLRRNETQSQRITAILSGLPEPVIAVDNFNELVLANPSAEKLFSIDAQNTEQRALAGLVDCERLLEMLTETRRRKAPSQRSGEIQVTDPDGSPHWYSVTTRTIAVADPTVAKDEVESSGVVAVLRDISMQKATQKRNAEFVSAVSHEMKTPLAGIKAYVELLVDGDAEDEKTQEEFLQVINGQADRLQRLVDNLLNLARIEAGVVSVSKQSRSLNDLLEEAFRVVQPAAEKKQIELQSFLSTMYLGVLADRDMMLQAAINLLSNAIKYTPEGGRVVLRSRLSGREVQFEVEDTGVGLSPEDCSKVFEKFYRVQKDKDMASGTGLGLPLAKHIVEDVHGGKLCVESQVGKGSIFSVTLPGATQMN